MVEPLVSVAVLAYNRRDALATTLGKVTRELEYPSDRLEVIVVDNASTDGTAEMVAKEFPGVRLLRSEVNEGVAGWNRAFEVMRGDWCLILDDDCYVDGTAVRRALDAAAEYDADLVSFWVESSDPGAPFTTHYQTGLLSFWGCSALVSSRALKQLGGFDPGIFIYAHEVDFTMRLLDRGFGHVFLPDAQAVHMKPLPAGLSPAGHVGNMRNLAFIAGKSLRAPDAVRALTHLLVRSLAEHVGRLPSRVPPRTLLSGFADGLRVRQPVRRATSRLYRRDFVEFANHLPFVRGPVARWRDRHRDVSPMERRELYWERRRALYPLSTTAVLRVP